MLLSKAGAPVKMRPLFMRWLLNLLKSLFTPRPRKTGRAELLEMYLGESNHTGRRKANRDRA